MIRRENEGKPTYTPSQPRDTAYRFVRTQFRLGIFEILVGKGRHGFGCLFDGHIVFFRREIFGSDDRPCAELRMPLKHLYRRKTLH